MEDYIWQGTRVRLRALEPDDWEHFARWDLDTDAQRHGSFLALPKSEERLRKWAAEEAARTGEDDSYRFVIEDLEGTAVGTISTFEVDRRSGAFAYGLSIAREHWRKGYASQAIYLLLRFYFRELRYQKATAYVFEYNERSQALHESLGFVKEGLLRRTVWANGRVWDSIAYGMTVEEFDQLERGGWGQA
jgi:RimJ/RimL family protein N-acetyltransferase